MDGQKPEQTPAPMQFAPGDTIRPQQDNDAQAPGLPAPVESASAAQPLNVPEAGATAPVQPPAVPPVTPVTAQPIATSQPPAVPTEQAEMSGYAAANQEAISWTASEFIAHHKTSGWYFVLLLASSVGAALIWLVTKDIVSALVVMFAGGIFGAYAARQPRQLSYQVDPSGLTIGQKHYGFNEFRSFSVMPEGAFSSIIFSPLKRFGTLVTIYYDPEDEERIIEALSLRLPHEERRPDPIDGMMRRIRF